VAILTKDLERELVRSPAKDNLSVHNLNVHSATRGEFVVRPQDDEARRGSAPSPGECVKTLKEIPALHMRSHLQVKEILLANQEQGKMGILPGGPGDITLAGQVAITPAGVRLLVEGDQESQENQELEVTQDLLSS